MRDRSTAVYSSRSRAISEKHAKHNLGDSEQLLTVPFENQVNRNNLGRDVPHHRATVREAGIFGHSFGHRPMAGPSTSYMYEVFGIVVEALSATTLASEKLGQRHHRAPRVGALNTGKPAAGDSRPLIRQSSARTGSERAPPIRRRTERCLQPRSWLVFGSRARSCSFVRVGVGAMVGWRFGRMGRVGCQPATNHQTEPSVGSDDARSFKSRRPFRRSYPGSGGRSGN